MAELADAGLMPYLRGYGGTRFASAETVRSGQQAALAHDLRELIGALGLAAPQPAPQPARWDGSGHVLHQNRTDFALA